MLQFRPMSEVEYESFSVKSIHQYALSLEKAQDLSYERAFFLAQNSFHKILPEGFNTSDHYFSTLEFAHQKIGIFWFHLASLVDDLQEAYIYDIFIEEEFRGQGLGEKAIQQFEELVRAKGIERISLHAFAHNKVAIQLYTKMGYITTSVLMNKTLLKQDK